MKDSSSKVKYSIDFSFLLFYFIIPFGWSFVDQQCENSIQFPKGYIIYKYIFIYMLPLLFNFVCMCVRGSIFPMV